MQEQFAIKALQSLPAVKEGLFCVAWVEEETAYESEKGIPVKRNEKCYYRVQIMKVKDNDVVSWGVYNLYGTVFKLIEISRRNLFPDPYHTKCSE